METVEVEVLEYVIPKFWNSDFKALHYVHEPFNDQESVSKWLEQGYHSKITGDMCDMRSLLLPTWTDRFIKIYQDRGWKNIGLSFYRMKTATVMPVHQDLYKRYVELFDLKGKEKTIRRALVLLEDWKSGHYLEVKGKPYVGWRAGTTVEWVYDVPHMAANLGLEDRYSLQITGHL